jgi:hypothetical protein
LQSRKRKARNYPSFVKIFDFSSPKVTFDPAKGILLEAQRYPLTLQKLTFERPKDHVLHPEKAFFRPESIENEVPKT